MVQSQGTGENLFCVVISCRPAGFQGQIIVLTPFLEAPAVSMRDSLTGPSPGFEKQSICILEPTLAIGKDAKDSTFP